MPEPLEPHVELGGYVLGRLEPAERERFEEHLAGCAQCREELGELTDVARSLERAAPRYDLPAGLEGKTFAAVERAAVQHARPLPEAPEPRWWRLGLPGKIAAVAAVTAVLVFAGYVGSRLGETSSPGVPELLAVLRAPGGQPVEARARVVKMGIGRVISFRTDELPILPQGEYYELWFVGPEDTLEDPNRISAGTFHPDENGRSRVTFAAAVDPKRYPVLSVTAEPGDGNPQRTGPEVLRSEPDG